jgi:hypothetical protein
VIKQSISFAALAFALVSCSSMNSAWQESRQLFEASQLLTTTAIRRETRWVIPAHASFYIARSQHISSVNPAHANALTDLLETAVSNSFSGVRIGLFPESPDYALRSAQRAGSNYVVYPRLLAWDDRLGTWTEILTSLRQDSNEEIVAKVGLDHALVQLIILDTMSGKQVDIARIESGSGWLSLYDDQPATILLPGLLEYFDSLRV